MLTSLNDQDRSERNAIIAEIHAAFAGVTRGEHGISWKECEALDDYKPPEVCQVARQSDQDQQWTELIADPAWDPFPGNGGFCFINPEGFRYYLPPTMIRLLGGDDSEWFNGHLLGFIARNVDPEKPELWSPPQLRAIARFIEFMALHEDAAFRCPGDANEWDQALRRHWRAFLTD